MLKHRLKSRFVLGAVRASLNKIAVLTADVPDYLCMLLAHGRVAGKDVAVIDPSSTYAGCSAATDSGIAQAMSFVVAPQALRHWSTPFRSAALSTWHVQVASCVTRFPHPNACGRLFANSS
jgi:hypothetical protein